MTSISDPTGTDLGGGMTRSSGGIILDVTGVPALPIAKDAPFSVMVHFANVPLGAGLIVGFTRNAEPRDRARYFESGGTFTLRPVAIEGNGSVVAEFTGQTAMAPGDRAAFFPQDAGEFRLFAAVIDGRGETMGMLVRYPATLATYHSQPIVLTGERASRHVVWQLTRAFEEKLVEGLGLCGPGNSLSPYYQASPLDVIADPISMTFTMLSPFRGTFQVSVPSELNDRQGLRAPRLDQMRFLGEIGFEEGVVSYRTARAIAARLFESLPLLGRAPPTKTELPSSFFKWIYLPAEHVWLLCGTRQNRSGTPFDHAVFEVSADGTPQLIEHKPLEQRLEMARFYDTARRSVAQG